MISRKSKYWLFLGDGSQVRQVLCSILISFVVFCYGMSIGWMSPMTLLLQSEQTPTAAPLSDHVVSWMASAPYLLCVPADFTLAYLEEKIGRKKSLILISLITVFAWALKLFSQEPWAFILARGLFGIPMGGSYVVCPVYIKEISEDSIRGVMGSLVVLSQTSGNLVLYILGDILSYNAILWFCLALPVVHILLVLLVLPESPSYLVKHGRTEEARRALSWLRCRREEDQLITDAVEEIRIEQEKDSNSSSFAMKAILTDKILKRAFWVALMVTLAREVCGANPVLNFAGYIFDLASQGTLLLTPNQQAMMLGAVQVGGAVLASSVVEKSGRKPLLFWSSLVSGLGMCGLASWFLAREFGFAGAGWIPITSLCLCIFCDASGLQPISVVIMNEIFSFKFRSTVSAVTMSLASAADFLQLLTFKPIAASVGIHWCFYFFGAFCLGNCVYIALKVPETKMKSLDQIYEKLKTKKEKEREKLALEKGGESYRNTVS